MSGFWQKRRAAVAAEQQDEARVAAAAAGEAQEIALAERSDEELLAELDLPAPEELVSGEQLRAFLRAQLPQRLKTRALRSFWRTNPVLACLDGLNDYDDDYTAAATAGKPVNTLYQVGRGIVAKIEETLEQEVPDGEPAMAALPDAVPTPDVSLTHAAEADPVPDGPAPAASDVEEEAYQPAPTTRRMRFEFAGDLAQDVEDPTA